MKNPLCLLAGKLYIALRPLLFQKQNPKISGALRRLYPQENWKKRYEEFQIRRLTIIITILFTGTVAAALFCLCSRAEGKLAEGAQLIRNEWGAGDYKVALQAETEDWSREFPFWVKERAFSGKEKETLFQRLYKELPDLIKKDNQDIKHVTGDLNLVTFVEGYPFKITWSSKNSEKISRDGRVSRADAAKEGERIELTAKVSDGEENRSFVYEIFLLPELLDEEEVFFRKLNEELFALDLKQASEKNLTLPDNVAGKAVNWREKKTNGGTLLIFLSVFSNIFISIGMENDLIRNCKKRERQLLADYPDFVSKLRLYLSAGLTVKTAFIRIAQDGNSDKKEKEPRYLQEEMMISCRQLENGVMEKQVYQDFGRRCGEMRYRRIGFLLSVHLKQGNGQLLTLLEGEAESAQEDKRSFARKAGEEAGTKLLLPMILMLVVIMFLVLLPAYMDFGNI